MVMQRHLFTLFLALSCFAPAFAQTRLSDAQSIAAQSSVDEYLVTDDSNWIVYVTRPEDNPIGSGSGDRGLFSVPFDGSLDERRLSPPLVAPAGLRLSPNQDWVTFQSGGVWVAPIDGGAPATRIDRSSRLFDFRASDQALVYGYFDLGVGELRMASIDGATGPVVLSGPEEELSNQSFNGNPRLVPDGSGVVYVGAVGASRALYYARFDQPAQATRLTTLDPFDHTLVALTADRAIYTLGGSLPELRSVRIDGSQPSVVLSSAGHGVRDIELAANERIVFLSRDSLLSSYEVYSARVDGAGTPVALSGPSASGNPFAMTDDRFVLSPDRSQVLFRYDPVAEPQSQLYLRAVDGSSPLTVMNGNLVAGGGIATGSWGFTPDGAHVVYIANEEVFARQDLYSVPVTQPRQSVSYPSTEIDISTYSVSADSSQVLFASGGLWLATIGDPGSSARVSLGVTPSTSWGFVGDSIVWQGAGDQLRSRPRDLATPPVQLNSVPVTGNALRPGAVTNDKTRIVFLGDNAEDGGDDLFSSPIDGSEPAKLQTPRPPFWVTSQVYVYRVSPDGERAVYYQGRPFSGIGELWSVPTDGSERPRAVMNPVPNPAVSSFEITSDSQTVVFVGSQFLGIGRDLCSAPIEGGGPVVQLNDPAPAAGAVRESRARWRPSRLHHGRAKRSHRSLRCARGWKRSGTAPQHPSSARFRSA